MTSRTEEIKNNKLSTDQIKQVLTWLHMNEVRDGWSDWSTEDGTTGIIRLIDKESDANKSEAISVLDDYLIALMGPFGEFTNLNKLATHTVTRGDMVEVGHDGEDGYNLVPDPDSSIVFETLIF